MGRFEIRYFAAAEEFAGRDAEHWELAEPCTVGALQQALTERYGPGMARVLRSGSLLVDGVIQRDADARLSGDTVDVLPAFAGG